MKRCEQGREIIYSLADDDSETEAEVEAIEEAEVVDEVQAAVTAETPEAERPAEIDQAVTLLNQFREKFDRLDAEALEPEALDGLIADLGKLREVAEVLKHRRQIAPMLARINESSARYVKTIAQVGAEAAIEAQRVHLSTPGVVVAEVEAWLKGMVERLAIIEGHDEEIQDLMRQISAAAAENDLATIQQHTGAAHERKTQREEAVNDLRSHLG